MCEIDGRGLTLAGEDAREVVVGDGRRRPRLQEWRAEGRLGVSPLNSAVRHLLQTQPSLPVMTMSWHKNSPFTTMNLNMR